MLTFKGRRKDPEGHDYSAWDPYYPRNHRTSRMICPGQTFLSIYTFLLGTDYLVEFYRVLIVA